MRMDVECRMFIEKCRSVSSGSMGTSEAMRNLITQVASGSRKHSSAGGSLAEAVGEERTERSEVMECEGSATGRCWKE